MGDDYRVSGYRDGSDLCLLNALSQALVVEVRHAGQSRRQEFRGQQPIGDEVIAECAGETTTIVTFYPDPAIFPNPRMQWDPLYQYLRQSTYLVPGLTARLINQQQSPSQVFEFSAANGVRQWVLDLTTGYRQYTNVINMMVDDKRTQVSIALQYTNGPQTILSFANNYQTVHGGAHVSGLKKALAQAWEELGETDSESDRYRNLMTECGSAPDRSGGEYLDSEPSIPQIHGFGTLQSRDTGPRFRSGAEGISAVFRGEP